MRSLIAALVLASTACTRPPERSHADSAPASAAAPTSHATLTTPVFVGPFDTAGAKALALATPVCDSTAAALTRKYREPRISRGTGYLDLGDNLERPACTLTVVAHSGVEGAPPLPLSHGPTEDGWTPDDRFMADGVDGETYGFRGHGVACSVGARWDDPGDIPDSELAHYKGTDELRIDVSCAADPSHAAVPAESQTTAAESDAEPSSMADLPWKGREPLNIENRYSCYWYADLTVVVVPFSAEARDGVPGEDIIVRPAKKAHCGRDSLPDDFVIRAGFFNRFRGIIDSTLIVEDGDAATYSGLRLYDLSTRRQVADLSVAGLVGGLGNGYIGVWMSDTTPPASVPCPSGGGIRVQRLMIVTLATGELTAEGSRRCRFEE